MRRREPVKGGRRLAKRPVSAFRLQAQGLARVLGAIEAEVMDFIWAAGEPVPLRAVHAALQASRPLSVNTVVSVLNHLVDKGLLRRRRAGRGHLFAATVSREEFVADVSHEVASGLIRDFGRLAVAQFVAALREEDPQALAALAKVLRGEEGPARDAP
jgi:predicted transcriptional regulator